MRAKRGSERSVGHVHCCSHGSASSLRCGLHVRALVCAYVCLCVCALCALLLLLLLLLFVDRFFLPTRRFVDPARAIRQPESDDCDRRETKKGK